MTARAPKPSADDLRFAADWLDGYNDGEELHADSGEPDPLVPAARRVRAWLIQQAEAAEEDAAVRELVLRAGGDPANAQARAAARRVLRRHRAEA